MTKPTGFIIISLIGISFADISLIELPTVKSFLPIKTPPGIRVPLDLAIPYDTPPTPTERSSLSVLPPTVKPTEPEPEPVRPTEIELSNESEELADFEESSDSEEYDGTSEYEEPEDYDQANIIEEEPEPSHTFTNDGYSYKVIRKFKYRKAV